jgi:uncharacterized membrane protein YeiH
VSKSAADRLLLVLDLLGTFVFAVEGAMAAIGGQFDALGVLVLSFSTALGGGIVRDVLLGALPAAAVINWRYPLLAFSGGALVFMLHPFVARIPMPLLAGLDAIGLSLCAVAGAEKALTRGVHPFMAMLMGAVNGVGGGTIRDVLMARSPNVLHSDVYAVAAMIGAAAMIGSQKAGVRPLVATVTGALVCFAVRMVAVWQHWNLPRLV